MKYNHKVLDQTDFAILELLQNNCEISRSELGRQIGMSTMAVSGRIARIKALGIIRGYTLDIDYESIGLPIHAFIIVDLIAPDKRREFDNIINNVPQIAATYYVMSGGKEAILNVYCRDYQQLIALQSSLSDIVSFSTFILMPQAVDKTIKIKDLIDIICEKGDEDSRSKAVDFPELIKRGGYK